ncbi:MAG: hypothetical protein COB73_06815 [Flavobacteriaceae bacterium]|nr:MAG: hypothetical protein COB73_06815 [Flavobacteriaceae bacterium]
MSANLLCCLPRINRWPWNLSDSRTGTKYQLTIRFHYREKDFNQSGNPETEKTLDWTFASVQSQDLNGKDAQLMSILGDMLQLRFTETLREEEGGTYGASSWGNLSKEPKQQAYLSVSFDCNPDKVETLVKIVNDEIKAIANGTIKQVDLDKTLTNYLKEREEAKNYNKYEMSLLKNYVLESYNMNDADNFENIINTITAKDIQDITTRLLDDSESFEIVFKPKK